jgi:hypothetical protein
MKPIHVPTALHVLASVSEVSTGAAVDPAAVDEQHLVAVIERCLLDLVLIEVQLGHPVSDPVEQFEPVGVAVVHRSSFRSSSHCLDSVRLIGPCSGWRTVRGRTTPSERE